MRPQQISIRYRHRYSKSRPSEIGFAFNQKQLQNLFIQATICASFTKSPAHANSLESRCLISEITLSVAETYSTLVQQV